MKVRIGVGAAGLGPAQLEDLASAIVGHHLDSLWLAEVLTAPTLDPLTALSWLAGRNARIKLGTTLLVPGRNPLRLAKELATLDALSGGRLLLTAVPGIGRAPEGGALGSDAAGRAAAIEAVLPLLRRLWAGETVTWSDGTVDLREVRLAPLPAQDPLEVWLGGRVPAALRRCGRLGDGWLPSLCTPAEAAAGRVVIDASAADAGRTIDPEHFGVSIGYRLAEHSPRSRAEVATRGGGHPAEELVPVGYPALRDLLGRFVEVGFTKFVVRPTDTPEDWPAEVGRLADAVGDLQT